MSSPDDERPLVGAVGEATRFVLALGTFGKSLGPKELVAEMREAIQEMKKGYGAV